MSFSPIVAVDTAAVRSVGIDDWLANRAWPISEAQYHEFVDHVWEAFDAALAELSGIEEDAFLAATAMVGTLIQHGHDVAVHALAGQRGWRYVRGDGAAGPAAPHWPLRSPVPASASLARRLAKRWVFNRHRHVMHRAFAVAAGGDAWIVGSRSPIKLAWANEHGCTLDAPDIYTLVGPLSGNQQVSDGTSRAISRVVNAARDFFLREFSINHDLSELEMAWREKQALLLEAGERLAKHSFPKVLLMGEVAKPLSKVVASVARRRGAHVVADAHGLQVGHLEQRALAWSECGHVSEYVCYNAFHREAMAHAYAKVPIARRNTVEFTSLPHFNAFSQLQSKLGAPRRSGGRSIMIIGQPMNTVRYQYSSGDFFAVQLALEIEISRLLRSHGFRVIYKAHPERLAEIAGLFEGIVDHVETRYLDAVWHEADGFVFGCLTTTAFNIALLTDRPVALIDFDCLRWNTKVEALIARRAVLVPASIDENLRARFDGGALIGAFEQPAGQVDRGYARECLELSD